MDGQVSKFYIPDSAVETSRNHGALIGEIVREIIRGAQGESALADTQIEVERDASRRAWAVTVVMKKAFDLEWQRTKLEPFMEIAGHTHDKDEFSFYGTVKLRPVA